MKIAGCLTLLLFVIRTHVTHLLGGYIQAKPVAGSALTYTITVTLYTDPISGASALADMKTISVCLGDGQTQLVDRTSVPFLNASKTLGTVLFQFQHTYAGPGAYPLTLAQANRSGIRNSTQAVTDQPLILTTTLTASNALPNQTPQLALPETAFDLPLNRRAMLSFRATDADGDSLAYRLAVPLTNSAAGNCSQRPLGGYRYPNDLTQRGTFTLNARTGELTWDAPVEQGLYTLDLQISEYRNGVLLSQTLQEVPLIVRDIPGTTPTPLPPYQPASTDNLVTAVAAYADGALQLSVFPNPVDDPMQVVVKTSERVRISIQLLDSNGRLLYEGHSAGATRRHEQRIDMGSLSAGTYLIRAQAGERVVTEKVVKK